MVESVLPGAFRKRSAIQEMGVSPPSSPNKTNTFPPKYAPLLCAGPASSAHFQNPCGVSSDGEGGAFVADAFAHVIRRIFSNGTITTFAGGFPGLAGDGGA